MIGIYPIKHNWHSPLHQLQCRTGVDEAISIAGSYLSAALWFEERHCCGSWMNSHNLHRTNTTRTLFITVKKPSNLRKTYHYWRTHPADSAMVSEQPRTAFRTTITVHSAVAIIALSPPENHPFSSPCYPLHTLPEYEYIIRLLESLLLSTSPSIFTTAIFSTFTIIFVIL